MMIVMMYPLLVYYRIFPIILNSYSSIEHISSAVCVLSCGRYRNEGNRVKARCLVITALNSDYECETPAYRYTQAWYISNRMITYTVLHYTTSINEWCLHYRFWRLHLIVLLKGKCREQLCLTLPFRGLQVL